MHAVLVATNLLAQVRGDGHMNGWDVAWMGLWMVVLWGGLIAVVVGAVVWAVRRSSAGPEGIDPNQRARQELAERYARSEIGTDEYRERLDALR